MSDWNAGYIADIEYVTGFYREQSPDFLNFVCLLNGYEPHHLDDGYTYCELGCGLGYTVSVLAAADPRGRFHGIDFNPAHIAYARNLAEDAGLDNVTFHEASFDELTGPDALPLPDFDIITLHGVYSWITPQMRLSLVEFFKRKLKPGGIVYVSYNSLPGWTGGLPVQRLLAEYGRLVPERSDRRAVHAATFLKDLAQSGARILKENSFVDQVVRTLHAGDVEYLAHEYLNENWLPLYHVEVAREFATAKLAYTGSATLLENFPDLSLTPEQKARLDTIGPPSLRETFKDYVIPKLLRRDVFVRGARRMPHQYQQDVLRRLRLALVIPRGAATTTIQAPLGEASISEKVYVPIFDALADRPHTIAELLDLPGIRGETAATPAEIAGMLTGTQQTVPLPDRLPTSGARVQRFNEAAARQFLYAKSNTRTALASSVLGTGVYLNVVEMLCYLAMASGAGSTPDELAHFVWQPLKARGEKLVFKGEEIAGEEQNLALLREHAEAFQGHMLPLLRRLGAFA